MKKQKLSTAISLLLCFLLLLSCAGCTQPQDDGSGEASLPTSHEAEPQTEDTAGVLTGRYVETELTIPYSSGYLWNMHRVGDSVYIFGNDGDYVSTDGAKSWQPYDHIPELVAKYREEGFGGGSPILGKDGQRLYAMTRIPTGGDVGYPECRYVLVEPDGAEREIPVRLPSKEQVSYIVGDAEPEIDESKPGTYMSKMIFLPDGSIVGEGGSHDLYHVDIQTGQVLHTIERGYSVSGGPFISAMAATPSSLLVVVDEAEATLYDLETWEPREDGGVITDFMMGEGNRATENGIVFESGMPRRYLRLYTDLQEEAYYILDSTGIYRYIPGGTVLEQLVPAEMNAIAYTDNYGAEFVKMEDNSFIALFSVYHGHDYPEYTMAGYAYDPDELLAPQEKFTIYSIFESEYIQQGVATFQKNHPELHVVHEAALEKFGSGDQISDAVRVLNTEIMAGTGPDVIVMDRMSLAPYRDKGLLIDLTDTLSQAEQDYDLLENVTHVYEKDGQICAVPMSFCMNVVVGSPELLDRIDGLDSLVSLCRELREENPDAESILGMRNAPAAIIDGTMGMRLPVCMTDYKEIDWDMLRYIYQSVKDIYDAETSGIAGAPEGDIYSPGYLGVMNAMGLGIRNGECLLEIREVNALEYLHCLYTCIDEDGITYKALSDNGVCGFNPSMVFTVSAKSAKQEEAKEFIRLMLSDKMQSFRPNTNVGELGIPVNKNALLSYPDGLLGTEDIMYRYDEQGHPEKEGSIRFRYCTREDLADFITKCRPLNATVDSWSTKLQEAIFFPCSNYCYGEMTLDEAIQSARDGLELYLAEA